MSEIENLRMKVAKLAALLDDPEPGIFHWHLAVSRLRAAIGAGPSTITPFTEDHADDPIHSRRRIGRALVAAFGSEPRVMDEIVEFWRSLEGSEP